MKINSTQNHHQQNFGMAFITNAKVNKVLQSRIKTPEDTVKLIKLFEKEGKNTKINIELFCNESNNLSAKISSNNLGGFEATYDEGLMASRFRSPIYFLEKLSKIADKQSKYIK